MIAYNTTWLYNLHVRGQADEAAHEEFISPETRDAVYSKYPVGFYTPNYFVRIGLALLAIVVVAFSTGLLALLTNAKGMSFVLGVIGIISIAVAEMLIKNKHHYNSGIDNMLVWLGGLFAWLAFLTAIELEPTWYGNDPSVQNYAHIKLSLAALVIGSAIAIRYVDVLMSIAATISFILLIFFCCQHCGGLIKTMTPFIMIVIFGSVYMVTNKARKKQKLLFYHNCLLCMSITALVAFYASGNCYLVNELSNYSGPRPAGMGGMDWFFWVWTIALPIAYVVIGVRRRDITLIRVGIPLIAVAVLTFRYYYHVMAPETAMMLGGTILIIMSYSLIRRLSTPKGGFTFQPETFVKDSPDIGRLITGELVKNAGQAGDQPQTGEWG